MQIVLNGRESKIPENFNLADLLRFFDLPERRVAVELNRRVIRKADWEATRVTDGDRVEVVHFVGGG